MLTEPPVTLDVETDALSTVTFALAPSVVWPAVAANVPLPVGFT